MKDILSSVLSTLTNIFSSMVYTDDSELNTKGKSMNFNFTEQQLQQMLPLNNHITEWYNAMCKILPQYNIDTPARVAAFVAQCAHESLQFTVLIENLNYGQSGLLSVFRKYFHTSELASEYARKPEKIANRVYANRMGNGDESSGDGWKYRGRGVIQLTGHNNYQSFGNSINMPIDELPEYLTTYDGALQAAAWFWDTNNLNKYADINDIVTMTKRINGGTNGLADREKHYYHDLKILESQ